MKIKLTVAGALVGLLALGATAVAAGGWGGDAQHGSGSAEGTDFQVITTQGISGTNDAGNVLATDLQIDGVGQAEVTVDASWDWSTWSTEHACALVDTSPQTMLAFDTDPEVGLVSHEYQATVEIVKNGKNGGTLVGTITGGSVCEVEVFAPAQSINRWLIGFEIDGEASTGKFAGASGQGLVDYKIDSRVLDPELNPFVDPFQVLLNLD